MTISRRAYLLTLTLMAESSNLCCPRFLLVFTESPTGDSYPGNLDEIEARCARKRGRFLALSSDAWYDGDRVALCHEPPLTGESFG